MSSTILMYGTKGGVGKSTIAVNTAYALSARGARVGLVDLDLSGPNVSELVGGLDGSPPTMAEFRVLPGRYGGVDVSSLGFFVQPHEAGLLTGKYLEGALEQLVFHNAWAGYDYVVVDLPPGFDDLHRQVFSRLAAQVVLITTPHVLSTADLARGRRLLDQLGVGIRGLVENMSHIACEYCGRSSRLFVAESGDPIGDLPLLARVPFAPEPAQEAGRRVPLLLADAPGVDEFRSSIFTVADLLMRRN